MLPLIVAAQAAGADGSSSSTNLLGIAAIIAAVVPIVLAVLNYALKRGNGGDDDATTAAIGDARERIELLRADRDDLSVRLEQCRSERQVLEAEARVKDMMIGDLTGRISECHHREQALKDELAQAERALNEALKTR